MREYQQKRKLGIFQSYDMNIDSYPHFSERGKNLVGVDKKTWSIEKTHTLQLLKYQSVQKH